MFGTYSGVHVSRLCRWGGANTAIVNEFQNDCCKDYLETCERNKQAEYAKADIFNSYDQMSEIIIFGTEEDRVIEVWLLSICLQCTSLQRA